MPFNCDIQVKLHKTCPNDMSMYTVCVKKMGVGGNVTNIYNFTSSVQLIHIDKSTTNELHQF